ncbi:MAG: ATP-binding protein [Betaproteobacteria bacterium]|nr:ATP-binding protein [Betaproteobacteria bacterium]
MIRLFIKMYGLLIATLVVSFYIQTEVIDYFRSLSAPVNVRERFSGAFFMIEQELKRSPPATWPEKVAQMKPGFGTPLSLESRSALQDRFTLSGDRLAAFDDGRIVTHERKQGGFYLSKRVGGSDQGILLEFPGPRDMRREIYAINWTIEFLMVALLLWFWVRPFWRDLMALRGAAEKVGGGDLDVQVNMRRSSPLFDFAHRFNEMTARINTLMKSQKELTNSVSHELRTPLARLRFSQHLATDEPTAEGKDRYLALMDRDIDELDELSSELLTYAKLESGTPDVVLVKVPAAPWLEDILDAARRLADAEGKSIRIGANLQLSELVCEPRYMARALSNLLRNALRFAETAIHVDVTQTDEHYRITVDDDGPGIPVSEHERLFQPFTRLDKSRDRATGGFGMGLAIVRQIALWHGGTACIGVAPAGGARIVIEWRRLAPGRSPVVTNRQGSAQSATHPAPASV